MALLGGWVGAARSNANRAPSARSNADRAPSTVTLPTTSDLRGSATIGVVDLDDLVPLRDPTALPRVLSRDAALDRGLPAHVVDYRIRSGRWLRLLPRTYVTAPPATWPDRLSAAIAFAGDGAMLSGAAVLHERGMRSVRRPGHILVLVPSGSGVRSVRWVRTRRTRRLPEVDQQPGPPCASVARALADYALARSDLDGVRAVVAEAGRRELCALDELAAELRAGPRNGSAHLRQALMEVTAGAWSAPEARAATLLRRSGAPAFEQNARIEVADRILIADFLWRQLRAVLEIDSVEHHFAPTAWRSTMDRHLVLETAGYSVIHRPPSAVRLEPDRFVRDIAHWLAARRRLITSR